MLRGSSGGGVGGAEPDLPLLIREKKTTCMLNHPQALEETCKILMCAGFVYELQGQAKIKHNYSLDKDLTLSNSLGQA